MGAIGFPDVTAIRVGSDADSASATGSVHAKLKDVSNYTNFQTHNLAAYQNNAATALTWYIVSNYTSGKGCLKAVYVTGDNEEMRITLDGNISTLAYDSQSAFYDGTRYTYTPDCNFDSSCKVEVRMGNSGGSSVLGGAEYITP